MELTIANTSQTASEREKGQAMGKQHFAAIIWRKRDGKAIQPQPI